ncbi:hypothetical protein JG688_00018081 [Phytophthora aleatoria]|uniref:Uncharacterized protein n=1 Tax=Phytophthora aleatoria TaxID=2496075 RepID=A0A8J5MBS8_9STRA|nr:hypothetical protein JG688_00018081 [Phytophthora aleatoria]
MFQLLDGDSSANFSPRILRGQQTPPLIAASISMKGRHPRHLAHVSAQARCIGFGVHPLSMFVCWLWWKTGWYQ